MSPIDLKKFALYSQKIPSEFLAPKKPRKFKDLAVKAWTIDMVLIAIITKYVSAFSTMSLKSLFVTNNLHHAWTKSSHVPTMFFFLGTTAVSYFFFSYFFNEGQTFGMKTMKCRISMKLHDMRDAFTWSLFSIATFISLGFFYNQKLKWVISRSSAEIVSKDHLYENFVMIKDQKAFSLIDKIESQTIEEDYRDYKIAA